MEIVKERGEDGKYKKARKVESSEDKVHFVISEYECRVIGHRFDTASDRFSKMHSEVESQINVSQDCSYWASKFLSEISDRGKDDEYYNEGKKRHVDSNYHINILLTEYECWMIGNRLYEIGDWYEKKGHELVATETKWLARRFHAEKERWENSE